VTQVTLLVGNFNLWPGGAPVSGTLQNCPPSDGTFTYSIEATGLGGTSRLQRQVLVTEVPTPITPDTPTPVTPDTPTPPTPDTPTPPTPDTPTPVTPDTPTPPTPDTPTPPVVYAFTATPGQIQAGECVNVSWQVGGDAVQIDLLRDGILIFPSAPFSGSFQDCLNTAGSYTYRLAVLGSNNEMVTDDRGVTVTEASSSVPLQGTTWFLESYLNGTTISPVLPGTAITAVFGEDGQLRGSSGCNTYSANYTADGSSIFIGPPIGTQSLCSDPPGIMEQEAAYLLALPMASSYQISSFSLTIQDVNGRIVLQYTARRT